jgi:hypothetical protein
MAYQNTIHAIRQAMRKFSEILNIAQSRHGRDTIQAVLEASVPVTEGGPRNLSQTPPPLEPAA